MKFFVSVMLAVMIITTVQAHEVYSSSYCSPCDCSSFDGWYIGGNVGWGIQDHTWVDRDAWVDNFTTDWALGSVCGSNDGVTAGIQGGYNWQCGLALLGFEVDANWADLESNKHFAPTATPATLLTLNDKMEWFGTIRGRAGIVANNLLLYASLGAAFADFKHKWTVTDGATTESFHENNLR